MNNQLLVGKREAVRAQAVKNLQALFCPTPQDAKGCGNCRSCKLIAEHRHYNIMWFAPQKNQYTRAELDGIVQKMAFALDPQEEFVFVIDEVELLSSSCANSLLKSIEEPPRGYSFILLAERTELVLPTIRSRCFEYVCHGNATDVYYPELCALFEKPSLRALGEFSAVYDRCQPSEYETFALLDQLVVYWHAELKQQLMRDAQRVCHIQSILARIGAAYQTPPMPGGAKLFWRNLFICLANVA